MAKLQVLISTLGAEGIARVEESCHPVVDGVEYLISWQQPNEDVPIPENLRNRSDFKFSIIKNRGLCRNRNNAISMATSPYCLISDDDVQYTKEELCRLIETFETNPEVDILTVKYHSHNAKVYPDHTFDIKDAPQGYYVSSIEIAFRLDRISKVLRFNESLGLGSPKLRCGEEDVLLYDAKKAGLKVQFVPIFVGTHNHLSTATRDHDEPYFWMAKGAVFSYIHPHSWWLRVSVNAWRASRKSSRSFLFFVRNAFDGVKYARQNRVFENC